MNRSRRHRIYVGLACIAVVVLNVQAYGSTTTQTAGYVLGDFMGCVGYETVGTPGFFLEGISGC